MKVKDGTTKSFEKGDEIIYIPKHLLRGNRCDAVEYKNLGVVHSINEKHVFVKFINENNPKATRPDDLYFIHNRPDLMEYLKKQVEND